MTGDLLQFPSSGVGISSTEGRECAEAFFAAPAQAQSSISLVFRLDDAETLLALCQLLDQKTDLAPATVLEKAVTAYGYLSTLPVRSGSFLFDEKEYYLGELALIAGCCSRVLSRREDARGWFDRSANWFLLTANSAGDSARVSYQRVALYAEEHNFGAVFQLSEPLLSYFERSGARDLALKCRYVRAIALKESSKTDEALFAFEAICVEAREINSVKVLGSVLVSLSQLYAELGKTNELVKLAGEAETFLLAQDNKIALAKLHWVLGLLLRDSNRYAEAVEALRAAQGEMQAIEMQGDVAALHLVIADLLLEIGQDRQAEWEIRSALPIIDELKMVPEGFAAMTLVRESLRRRSIDRGALRKLHGYFEEIGS